jgi:hypothetical protein
MAYAEKRGNRWRGMYRDVYGRRREAGRANTREEALNLGRAEEMKVFLGTWQDPRGNLASSKPPRAGKAGASLTEARHDWAMEDLGGTDWHALVPASDHGGDVDAFSVAVDTVTVGGTVIRLPPVGVTAVVGGNNVGKSTILRDIVDLLHRNEAVGLPRWHLVDELTVSTAGTGADALAWIDAHAKFVNGPTPGFVRMSSPPTRPSHVSSFWRGAPGGCLGPLASLFVLYADALSRSSMAQGTGQRPNIGDPPTHPLHHLQDNLESARAFSDISEKIFRHPLTLDRLSGNLYLRVGKPELEAPPIDAVTADYRDALIRLPLLQEQGDGMKSLLGLLLPVMTAEYPIVVIDEPEAFLHPPQAFELGKQLATLAGQLGIQIILATHDRNLLTGLLETDTPVSVIRLDRHQDLTTASQLAAEDVQELWLDPVLRYSNVLDGLFHRLVIVAEADPDCRFYEAAVDHANARTSLPIAPSEIFFVPANGKDGMHKVVNALAAVRVRVVASPDLDMLDDETKLRRLVESFGGDWTSLQAEYRVATQAFRAAAVDVTCADVLGSVDRMLRPKGSTPWTDAVHKQLKPLLRSSASKWKELQRFGMNAFSGEAAVRAASLLDRLDALGICCVRPGDLERMAPTLGVAKGPAWLPAALNAEAQTQSPAQDHVQRLLEARF